MQIRRDPLTGADLWVTTSRRHPEPGRPVQLSASSTGMAASVFLDAGEALVVAAVALGVDVEHIEATAAYEVGSKKHWSVPALVALMADIDRHMQSAAPDAGEAAIDGLLADADEAEAAAVER